MLTVSVIIPTFNYAKYICDAINSVLTQSFSLDEIEIIVIDDGSVDNTQEVLKPFIDKKQIKYFYQKNKGKANATKRGVQISSGKYIFNLDADDFFLPNKISESVKIFESNPDVVHVASAAKILFQDQQTESEEKLPVDIIGKPLDGKWLLNRFYRSNIIFGGGSTYAARAKILKSIEIPDAVDMYIDEFLILAILPFGKSFFLAEPHSIWRVHNSNYSGSSKDIAKMKFKGERLLSSSSAVLTYLEEQEFDKEIRKIYRLQHSTRTLAFKENFKAKTLKDIMSYAFEVFFEIRPTFGLIRNYHVINRLVPSSVFLFLKRNLKSAKN